MLEKVNNVAFGWLVGWLAGCGMEAGRRHGEFSFGYVHSEMSNNQSGGKYLARN